MVTLYFFYIHFLSFNILTFNFLVFNFWHFIFWHFLKFNFWRFVFLIFDFFECYFNGNRLFADCYESYFHHWLTKLYDILNEFLAQPSRQVWLFPLIMAIYAYYLFRVNMRELFYISIVLSYIAYIDILYYVMHLKCRSGKLFVFIFVGCFLVLPPLPLAKVHVINVNLLSNLVIVLFSSLN